MKTAFKTAFSAVAFAVAGMSGAQATVLDLSATIGNANVFSFNNFIASSSDVQGAIMAGGNVTLSGYSTNKNDQDAYGHYSLIAGGNLNFSNGSISNGDTYVKGVSTVAANGTLASPVQTGAAPANMSALATSLTQTSQALSKLAATSVSEEKYGGVYITGSQKSVEIITIDASWLNKSTYFNISNMQANATLIINFTGDTARFHDGYGAFSSFDNVLFNFATATTLTVDTGFTASLLAPNAVVKNGQGAINGTVIVGNWESGVQINSGNAFTSINVPGLVSAVPEPETYAMLLGGLGLMGFIARRRKQAAAR